MSSPSKTDNNTLVLQAVFKQTSINKLDMKRLAKDMGVETVNAASKRLRRCKESFGINQDDDNQTEKSKTPAKTPQKITKEKVVKADTPGKHGTEKKTGKWIETTKTGVTKTGVKRKRLEDDEDEEEMTEEESDAGEKITTIPVTPRTLPKRTSRKVIKHEESDTDEDEENGNESGFEDLDYSVKKEKKEKKKNVKNDSDGESEWGADA